MVPIKHVKRSRTKWLKIKLYYFRVIFLWWHLRKTLLFCTICKQLSASVTTSDSPNPQMYTWPVSGCVARLWLNRHGANVVYLPAAPCSLCLLCFLRLVCPVLLFRFLAALVSFSKIRTPGCDLCRDHTGISSIWKCGCGWRWVKRC